MVPSKGLENKQWLTECIVCINGLVGCLRHVFSILSIPQAFHNLTGLLILQVKGSYSFWGMTV